MASSRKSTNKTAHVLNVIMDRSDAGDTPASSAPPPVDPAPSPAAAPVIQAAPVIPAPAAFAPVVEVEHIPEDLSDQVRDALCEELGLALDGEPELTAPEEIQEQGLPAAPGSPVPAAPQASAPVEPPELTALSAVQTFVPQDFSSPAEAAQPEDAALPAAPEAAAPPSPAAAPAAAPPPGPAHADIRDDNEEVSGESGQEFTYFNIMQSLVNEKAPQYAKLMGVCPCSRCLADVEALALSHLEPKYIVARKDQRFPFSAYENRYNAAVTSQIIAACQLVMESPRH